MFESTQTRIDDNHEAGKALGSVRQVYTSSKQLVSLLSKYATNIDFKTAVDDLYTVEEIAEFGAVFTELQALIVDLETNHRAVIGM